uniref:Uncharacterized protein n=1 Tax=Meloidogyne enterolobii TaxID=390850 RepID=A0A6V7Y3I0_MELEN|nr:unnamed protein product [Meloidogyne enterolobii]
MEIIVSVEKRNVPNYVQPEGQAKFRVTFTPQEALEHLISVKFNGISVPGSPLCCPIQPSSVQRSPRPVRAGSEITYSTTIGGTTTITCCSHNSQLLLRLRGEEEEEKEIKLVGDLASAIVDEPKRFSIDAPPGIGTKVECNVIVVVNWSNSGGQSASVSICHESDNEPVKSLMMKRVKKGIHSIAFTPRLPGLHLITTKIDGVELPDPQGSPLPVRCYKQQDDSYWVEFTPEICGPHRIEVTFGDEPLIGSPFLCEVIDPKRVYVRGIDRPFSLRTLSNFIVSRKSAGDGALNVELVDSQNETLKLDRTKNSVGEDSFTFLPTRLGVHRLSVRLAGFAIPSSPFQIVVEEQKTSPTVYGAALDYSIERAQQASMIFDANKQPGGLKVEVKSPSGEKVRYTTNRRPDETTEIAFRPQEIGIYEVNIEFNNRLVNGSPFPVTVVDPTKVLIISDDRKQIIRPDGMLQLFVGQRNVINLDCSEAGPAKIRAEVRDADGELLPLEQQTQVHPLDNGKFQLLFTPRKSGKYKIYLYCSELVVPNAYPILAIAEQSTKMPTQVSEMNGERQRRHKEVVEEAAESEIIERKELILGNVKLRGSGLTTARIKEPAEFILDASNLRKEAMGKCTATLLGDRADIPVKLSALGNQVYKGVYTPLVDGKYQLSVKIDGNHVPGSPSIVNVKAPEISPAQLIEVDGRPLKMGILGEDMQTLIDARRAGPGQISAQCSGTSQLEYCELLDNGDGTYMLRIQPKELGKHTLSVKYENEHVRDSPFTFNVNHPPDPSKGNFNNIFEIFSNYFEFS